MCSGGPMDCGGMMPSPLITVSPHSFGTNTCAPYSFVTGLEIITVCCANNSFAVGEFISSKIPVPSTGLPSGFNVRPMRMDSFFIDRFDFCEDRSEEHTSELQSRFGISY